MTQTLNWMDVKWFNVNCNYSAYSNYVKYCLKIERKPKINSNFNIIALVVCEQYDNKLHISIVTEIVAPINWKSWIDIQFWKFECMFKCYLCKEFIELFDTLSFEIHRT